ncbi:MAG: PAS domain-containing protein [bacterium]
MKFLFKRPSAIPDPEPLKPQPPVSVPVTASVSGPVAVAPVAPPAAVATVAAHGKPAPEGYRQDHKSLYKQLLRGLYDAVLVTDPKGYVVDCNGRVQDAFLYDRNEVWDMEISKLIPGITPQLLERVKQGLSESRHVLIDARCVRKDGVNFPAEVAISSIDLINEGDMVFSVRNVERRKRQMQLLRSLQNALANDLSAVAVTDRDGLITYASQTLRTVWGYEKDEQVIGKPLASLWPNDPQADQPLKGALTGERWLGMLQGTTCDGRTISVGAAIDVDRALESQDVVGLVCSFVEIHEG